MPGGLAELGREAVGHHLDLAHEHFGDRQQPQPGAILLGVGVAVELIVGVHLAAVGVDARHAELVVLVAGDVGLEEREVVRVARDERQVLHFGLADRAAEIDLARLGDRRLAGDGDGFGDVADAQRQVDLRDLAGGQRDAALLELLEALQLARRPDTCRAAAAARGRCPSSLLITTRSAPVSVFVTVTVTPGSIAPLASLTMPSMVPFMACDCAAAGAASPSARRRPSLVRTKRDSLTCASWSARYRTAGSARSTVQLRADPRRSAAKKRKELAAFRPEIRRAL